MSTRTIIAPPMDEAVDIPLDGAFVTVDQIREAEPPPFIAILSPEFLADPLSIGRLGNYHELAALTGLDRTHIARALKGQAGMASDKIARLAEVIGVTPGALFDHMCAMGAVAREDVCMCGHHAGVHRYKADPGQAANGNECSACQCKRFRQERPTPLTLEEKTARKAVKAQKAVERARKAQEKAAGATS